MKNLFRLCSLLFSLLCMLTFFGGTALAVPVQTAAPIIGEIEGITITNIADHWSGGTMTVGGQVIIIPANLLINLPNDYQTLQELYLNAPAACAASGVGGTRETGLAKIDTCNARATGAQATILANMTNSGNVIAGQVDIFKALESVNGNITYVDPTQGYFMVNGTPGSSTTGVMIRVNDPTSRHTIQTGLGCDASTAAVNCSADVRFKIDPDNYTFCYISGYPACIPGPGINPANCLDANRPVVLPTPLLTATAPVVAADSRHFAPIKLGDNIKADGNFETVGGVTFFSASSVRIFVDLTTRTTDAGGNPDPTQPDYLIISEAGWDGPAYPASRVRGRFVTMASLRTPPTDIDYFSVHYDQANAPHEQILYTTQFNKQQGVVIVNAATGVYDSQIRFNFFPPGADGQNPCVALRNGLAFDSKKFTGTPVFPASYFPAGLDISNYCTSTTPGDTADIISNYKLMAPLYREVMARSTRQQVTGLNKAIDIHGNPSPSGQYKLPVSIEYGAFEDINLGMTQFPVQFSGNPFLLDRRLSPNGCFGPCENTQQPLTPFPFEGIAPDAIVQNFGFAGSAVPVLNRMFAFMDATGKMTGTLAWPPANPPAFPIVVTPGLNMFPPFADEDFFATSVGVPITFNVSTNDFAPFGVLDPLSVKIAGVPLPGIFATLPSGATVQVNPSGLITYTPAALFAGPDSFTYTIANNFGSVSLPGTVNVDVQRPPLAVADAVTTPARTVLPINVVANDVAGTSIINLASVITVPASGALACGGSITNQQDGIVLFTAPNAVPAGGTCTFTYTVKDTSVPTPRTSNAATVTVTITPSVVPVVVNDTATTTTGATVIIPVLANDTITPPATINPLSVAVTPPTGAIAPNVNSGSAGVNAAGTISYTAPATPGTYTFTYTAQNSVVAPATPSTSNVATVTVTVTQGHIAPVAVNDPTATATTGATTIINVIANDTATAPSAINPASLVLTTPTGGTAAANLDGTVTYTAPAAAGTYTFTYTVKDNFTTPATSNAATVTVTVTAGTNPVAVNDAVSTFPGLTIPITVLTNDTTTPPATLNPSSVVLTAPTGGTATVNIFGTVSYKAPAAPGTYTFTYTVKDNSVPPKTSNAATVTVTVGAATGTVTGVNLVANQPSPGSAGAVVDFNASATGGSGSYEYQYSLFNTTTLALPVVQPYSPAITWRWNTTGVTPGNYIIVVDARNAGSTAVTEAQFNLPYVIAVAATPATGVTLSTLKPAPQPVGTPITFYATGSGSNNPNYQYQFSLYNVAANTVSLVQSYSLASSWTWNTTGVTPGNYQVLVDVRSAGSTAVRDVQTILSYPITAAATPATGVTIFSSVPSPQVKGTLVEFAAQGLGSNNTAYQYQFSLFDVTANTVSLVQPYSSTATWIWDTSTVTPGNFAVVVDVRSAGSTAVRDAQIQTPLFTITP